MYEFDRKNSLKEQITGCPRILVVDDDPNIVELIQDVLATDYNVSSSSNAYQGLELLQKEQFDLLILDLGLPGLSGMDLLDELRRQKRYKDLPVLVVSAYTELRRRVGDLHVDGVLSKPFSLSQLENQVEALLQRRQAREFPRAAMQMS